VRASWSEESFLWVKPKRNSVNMEGGARCTPADCRSKTLGDTKNCVVKAAK
jgi:hypothetical protein